MGEGLHNEFQKNLLNRPIPPGFVHPLQILSLVHSICRPSLWKKTNLHSLVFFPGKSYPWEEKRIRIRKVVLELLSRKF
jgi:hypothetical protein